MYAPNFSKLATVAVRRLAWAMGSNMGQAVDAMVQYLPQNFDTSKVCSACRDNSKCPDCVFKIQTQQPPQTQDLPKISEQNAEELLEIKFKEKYKTFQNKKIKTINGLIYYIKSNSSFSIRTIVNVIETLGYSINGKKEEFTELTTELENCAEHGADIGISGFIYYSETIPFFMENRRDIVSHMEQTAAELGTDIISMVQNFGVFRHGDKPTTSEVGRALWDTSQQWDDLTTLYNVFAWYALEEVSRTWYRYLEENPAYHTELSA